MSEAPKDEKVKSILDNSLEWLETYFHRVESASQLHTLPLCTVTKEGKSLILILFVVFFTRKNSEVECVLYVGASFRERVLISLLKNVSFGKTITYGELASLTGSPGLKVMLKIFLIHSNMEKYYYALSFHLSGAQLAVGTAMSTNPFQLVVPCHRVVKSGNQVGKYSGGCRNSVKIWLLQHEGMNVDQKGIVSHAA